MTSASLPRRLRQHTASLLLLALVATLSPLPAAAQGNSKASQFYEDALTRYDKKDYPGAIIQLKNALQIDPRALSVQLLLGKALMQNGEIPAAEVALNEALRLGVNRAEVVVLLAKAYVTLGKQRELLEERTFDPAGLPRDVQVQLLLVRAGAHSDRNNPSAAFQSVEEARRLQPNSPDSWLAEIPLRVRARQFPEALAAADKALSLDPSSVEPVFQKGTVLHVRGDLAGALAAYEKALQKDPTYTEVRVAQIGILMDQGRLPEAATSIAELQKHDPKDARGAYFKSLLAERNGDVTTARAALKEVTDLLGPVPLEVLRTRPQYLMLNGMAHFGLGENEKAKQYLEEFNRALPNSPVTKLLARIYFSENKAAQAATLLEGYLRKSPNDGQALLLLAAANRSLGHHTKATTLIQQALKAGDDPAFRTALGISLVGEGKPEDGIRELEAVYRKDAGNTEAGKALVELYLRTGQGAKALTVAQALVKKVPSDAEFQNLLGMSQRVTGNARGATSSFEAALKINPNLTAATMNLARLESALRNDDGAVQRLQTLLAREGRNAEAMHELALIAERRGALNDAQVWLQKARDASPPKDVRWGLALVDFHLRHGMRDRALESLKTVAAQSPDDMGILLTGSRVYLSMGDTVAAKANLGTATRLAGFDARMQMQIAQLQMAANNPSGAAYSLEKALSTQPDLLQAQAMLTEAELRMGETAKAEKRAKDIATQMPRRAVGHSLQGDVAMSKGQATEAIAAYRRAHQAEPSTFSLLRLFGALSSQDAGRPAIQLAEQWLKSHPRDHLVYKALGDASARAGQFSSARSSYEAAEKLRPDDAELLNNLANVQMRLNDGANALKTAERALAAAPGNPLVMDTFAWTLFLNNQPDRALQLLRDARLRLPENAEIRYHLAAVLAQQGRKSEARAELEAALRAPPNGFESLADAQKLMQTLR
jgi:putative PEP-CTERM system TPR-repeat lipoprotein